MVEARVGDTRRWQRAPIQPEAGKLAADQLAVEQKAVQTALDTPVQIDQSDKGQERKAGSRPKEAGAHRK